MWCPNGGVCESNLCFHSVIGVSCTKRNFSWLRPSPIIDIPKKEDPNWAKIVDDLLTKSILGKSKEQMKSEETQARIEEYELALNRTQLTLQSVIAFLKMPQKDSTAICNTLSELHNHNSYVEQRIQNGLKIRSAMIKLTREEAEVLGKGELWDKYHFTARK